MKRQPSAPRFDRTAEHKFDYAHATHRATEHKFDPACATSRTAEHRLDRGRDRAPHRDAEHSLNRAHATNRATEHKFNPARATNRDAEHKFDRDHAPRSDRTAEHSQSRRQFLRTGAGALAGITLAPGVLLYEIARARPLDEAATAQNRWGMLVDVNRCADGCDACVTACNDEHGLTSLGRPKTDAQWIRKLTVRHAETGYEKSFPVMCQHCESPPCVDVCPTGASFRREDGIVLVDKHTCIGCRYCMIACPYKARSFIHEALDNQLPHAPRGKGTVESCTLCVHKVDRGDGTTACAEACAREGHHALLFGDLNDPDSEISKRLKQYGGTQIRADLNLNTGVRYQGI